MGALAAPPWGYPMGVYGKASGRLIAHSYLQMVYSLTSALVARIDPRQCVMCSASHFAGVGFPHACADVLLAGLVPGWIVPWPPLFAVCFGPRN